MSRLNRSTMLNLRYLILSMLILTILNLSIVSGACADSTLKLTPGFIYKLRCEGKLLISAVGDDSLIRIEALPKEIGCASVVKPLRASGTTNLILETSTGTITRLIEVHSNFGKPESTEIFLAPFVRSSR